MKWKNKYHEFDNTAKILCDSNTKYYLWGTANIGHNLFELCGSKINIVGVVDSNINRQGTSFYEFVIQSPEILESKKNYIVIVATSAYEEVKKELIKKGFGENVDFFDYFVFLQIYQMYKNNKLYSRRLDISLTERCTLKCKKCNMFMPYFKNPTDLNKKEILRDIDNYFNIVDYLESFNLLGGEPFLYKELDEIIHYVGEKYRKRIEHFKIFTNGTIMPNDELLKLFKLYDMEIQISDYTDVVPYNKKMEEIIKKLTEQQIKNYILKSSEWGDFGFPENPNQIEDHNLIAYFEACKAPFRGLYKNRVYFCHLETSAIRAGMFEDFENDYFDLEQNDVDVKKKFLEFDFGFSEEGAIQFCKKCRGCYPLNKLFVPAAEQV